MSFGSREYGRQSAAKSEATAIIPRQSAEGLACGHPTRENPRASRLERRGSLESYQIVLVQFTRLHAEQIDGFVADLHKASAVMVRRYRNRGIVQELQLV